MLKLNLKNTTAFLPAAMLLFVLLAASQTTVFAGNQPTATIESTGSIKTLRPAEPTERQFAAAQMRNENNLPSRGGGLQGGGLVGGDDKTRLGFSFAASILISLGGIWTLFVLLRSRFGHRNRQKARRRAKIRGLAMQPSVALFVFGFLFVAAIVGSQLTAPVTISAERRERTNRSDQSFSPASKAVFKSARQIGGDGITQIGSPVFDSQGNSYVRGGFTRTLTIGSTTLTASRAFDMFFAKYDPNGNPLWARQGSGSTDSRFPSALLNEAATVLTVDAGGNVYVGGSFVKTITLQGGANPSRTLADAAGGAGGLNYESFVAKYDSAGNLLWAQGGNSGSPQNPNNLEVGQNAIDQIVIGADGSPYVAGFVSGNRFFGTSFAGGGQSDILLTKLDPTTGTPVWKQIIGGTDDDNGLDLKIDSANNLYLIGNFASASITFPNGATFSNPDTDPEEEDRSVNTFIAKFNTSGANLWVKNLDNAETLGAAQIAVNQAGEIFLTGYFYDAATFDSITLTETEGSGDEADSSLGGYLAKMNSNGDFIWAKQFGGLGEGIALDGMGRAYIVGTFWDSGTFAANEANQESLASFGGEDLFVARFSQATGNLDWAKAIAASGVEGQIIIGDPTDPNNETENTYNPLGIAYNPARGTMFVSGDFEGAVAVDCQTLTTAGDSSQVYVAELAADNEPTSCRIWNGLDADDNNWESTDNWNGGVVPRGGDSVFVPYTGNGFDNPVFNPAANAPLTNLSIADDRTLTLQQDLTVNNRLDLLGGFVDAGNFTLSLGASAKSLSVSEGRVLGKVQKQFNNANSFVFPVGTENGYSPVTLANVGGAGSFTVVANQGAYPFAATDLPPSRAARWWNLTNNGLTGADLTFQYVEGDITVGKESSYRAYRIPTGGGAATPVPSNINAANKIVTARNVTEFSDWTLAGSRRRVIANREPEKP